MDEDLDRFDAELASLEATLGSATQMVATFHGELRAMQDSMLYTGRVLGADPCGTVADAG